jgi:hypothetical protein
VLLIQVLLVLRLMKPPPILLPVLPLLVQQIEVDH